ncbi:LysR substrate-binding domain-containing protein [Novosphingobium terrae]|uniref:LysR substrate-binding domain-containing protein n=1 Tax=Novosphingobium terrae TaxID=2726189 RepID=UPI001981D013|nr:LysR substrate-binding domain-containing protein [Novosphingobium terrae]
MIDLNEFAFFAAVVQHGGFTAAARATGVDKGRLSRHVAALEDRLGVRLLQRSTRSVTLTQPGMSFYEGCLLVLDGAQVASDSVLEFKKEPTGMIRVGCPVILAQNYLAPLLPRYMAAHPKVEVTVEATDRVLHPLEERFDVIFAAAHPADSSSLVARELGRIRRILVAQPSVLAAWGAPSGPADLADLPIIARPTDLQNDFARWSLEKEGVSEDDRAHRIQFRPRLVSGDLHIQREAARQGVGMALLPESLVADDLSQGRLARVLPNWFTPEYSVFLIYPTPRGILPSVRSFIDFVLANFAVGG